MYEKLDHDLYDKQISAASNSGKHPLSARTEVLYSKTGNSRLRTAGFNFTNKKQHTIILHHTKPQSSTSSQAAITLHQFFNQIDKQRLEQ
jgi:hypothetical protein